MNMKNYFQLSKIKKRVIKNKYILLINKLSLRKLLEIIIQLIVQGDKKDYPNQYLWLVIWKVKIWRRLKILFLTFTKLIQISMNLKVTQITQLPTKIMRILGVSFLNIINLTRQKNIIIIILKKQINYILMKQKSEYQNYQSKIQIKKNFLTPRRNLKNLIDGSWGSCIIFFHILLFNKIQLLNQLFFFLLSLTQLRSQLNIFKLK
ncbi:transmembrane protein, putative (macronuclear) [Tetrahymena thermophila SB210]|uniref:Transmembrane protein, putative n=1 Tax=Tetrahymena thermophila (strain SB210) TaxID=312017 RepID=W7X8Q6_TETTS|nr:transmembrane protein, putative [Tetrahymena thermophila SB210]EWS75755.1 transmembrane protein, putative [Tetrahymena thermophila SB210]|eukprot:XP_012651677.1 transmembrane protein, putative [Tetrahymena thermophila SB210]